MRPHTPSRCLQQTSTSVSDVGMVATKKMPAPNEVHFRPCRSEQACEMQPVRGSWLDMVLESPEALSVLLCKHVALREQCELIRIHIAWAFVESNYHCDLNRKAPHGCFSVELQHVVSSFS